MSEQSIQWIKKRSGHKAKFEFEKIVKAILAAGTASGEFGENVARRLALKVLNVTISSIGENIPTVRQLQDVAEEVLLSSAYKGTAKSYILYRKQHDEIREITKKTNLELVDGYLQKKDWRVTENSNMTFSLQGLNNFVSSEVIAFYWLNKLYSPEVRKAHIEGDFHIHDLSSLSAYCVGWDLQDLLTRGFKGVSGKVESRPPKHLRTALGQIVNFFYTLQGEAAGAQAFSNFDTLLAPFIRYDKLEYSEIKSLIRGFLFNINVPTRVGFQTPFTNLTLDLIVPKIYRNQAIIIAGKPQKTTYKNFQKELNIFNKAFLEVLLEGDLHGRVFTFPIPTYNITKDFDWDNPNLDLLWKVTAKYGIPYFSNFINSDMDPDDVRSMCCRLRLDKRSLRKRGGGLFGANPLTGSIGVVTINMARLGYLSKDKEEFKERLDRLMLLAKESLEIKRKVIENFSKDGLYPYSRYYLNGVKERFGQYWTNHFSTIGLIGINEACLNLLKVPVGNEVGVAFAKEILTFMREKLLKFQEETGNNYNLEATPAEGTSYRLAKIDRKKYKDIIVANNDSYVKEAIPFYTNSSQLPVNYTDDVFEALDLQDPLQVLYTGGTVFHIFLGEQISNVASIKKLVKVVCEKYRLPYFTITPTFSICPSCGYIVGNHSKCPTCKATTEVYSRVVGYLRPISQWNTGKQEEFKDRKVFKVV